MRAFLVTLVCVVAGLGVLGCVLPREAGRIREDVRLWDEADSEAPAEIEGNDRTRFGFFHEYDFRVYFEDATRGPQHTKVSLSCLGNLERNEAPRVRYHASDPSRVALNWTVNARWTRWGALVVYGVGALTLLAIPFGFLFGRKQDDFY